MSAVASTSNLTGYGLDDRGSELCTTSNLSLHAPYMAWCLSTLPLIIFVFANKIL